MLFSCEDDHVNCLQVSMRADGTVGTLDVVLPNNLLRQAAIHGTSITHFYPYKFMKAALSGAHSVKAELSTQVAIDANGLLKVLRHHYSISFPASTCHTLTIQSYLLLHFLAWMPVFWQFSCVLCKTTPEHSTRQTPANSYALG
jgi:hypothetical protein